MPCLKLMLEGPPEVAAEQRLRAALEAEHGVFGVVICHDRQAVEIDFEDDEVAVDRLIAVAKEQGFEARIGG